MITNTLQIKDKALQDLLLFTQDGTLCALAALDGLALHEFYPCGSRFFGDAQPESDFDFFIEDSDEVRHDLKRCGFEEQHFDYPDHNSICVLKSGEVHVITVRSAPARLAAQEHIIKNALERPKRDSHWWCKLYEELAGLGVIERWWDVDVDDRDKDWTESYSTEVKYT